MPILRVPFPKCPFPQSVPFPKVSLPPSPLLLQIGDALSDGPATDTMDYSLKQESDQIVRVGQRIAACMAK